jgi:hypothetical protein
MKHDTWNINILLFEDLTDNDMWVDCDKVKNFFQNDDYGLKK